MPPRPRPVLAVAVIAMSACAKNAAELRPTAPEPVAPATAAPLTKNVSLAEVGLDAAAMDRSQSPCEDFYAFACGTWLKNTPIPADRGQWTRSFSEIDKQNDETLKAILEGAASASEPGLKKLGAYYAACMDESAIEKGGLLPLKKQLDVIRAVKSEESLRAALLELQKVDVTVPLHTGVEQDMKDATRMIFAIDQGGLGLPDRDYYLKDDAKSTALRETYTAHLERMLALLGEKTADAKQGAQAILRLETELAKVSKSRVERRDPNSLYNKVDRETLRKLAGSFPWDKMFAALGKEDVQEINVTSLPFIEGVGALIRTQKAETWRPYLSYHLARSMANALPKAFADEAFTLTKALSGQKELEVRWKRCVASTDHALGELLAQPFLERRFGPSSKAATEQMVGEIRKAFGAGLQKLDWMDEATRVRAEEKMNGMAFLIGYPSKWKSYDWPVGGSYAANVLASRQAEIQREMAKLGRPVDRDEWYMTPPTVNAYYDPQKNQMVFPAGILQPPFYDPAASVAVNMGGMGMVVGHELTHGFDDEGSQYAADGNLHSWWEPATRERFEARTQCIGDQYAAYEPVPGVKLNGKLTMGENIADNGGVKFAFEAYRSMRKDAPERLVADGFNEDQQFFLAVAQAWCTNSTEEIQRMRAATDPHSPPRFRVNGALSNQPEFWKAFSCEPGSTMRPRNACAVW